MQLSPSAMSRAALIKMCEELQDDVHRKDLVIDGQLDKLGSTRSLLTRANKIVSTGRKKRGKLDKMSVKHIWNEFLHTVMQNAMSLTMTVMGAMNEGQPIKWLIVMGVANGVLGPLTMTTQKLFERH